MKSRFTIDMKFDHPTFTSIEINTANPKTMIDSTTQKTPIRVVECYGLKLVVRYGICPTSVVWATDEGFIDQMGSLT